MLSLESLSLKVFQLFPSPTFPPWGNVFYLGSSLLLCYSSFLFQAPSKLNSPHHKFLCWLSLCLSLSPSHSRTAFLDPNGPSWCLFNKGPKDEFSYRLSVIVGPLLTPVPFVTGWTDGWHAGAGVSVWMCVQAWVREHVCATVQMCDCVCACTCREQPWELDQM